MADELPMRTEQDMQDATAALVARLNDAELGLPLGSKIRIFSVIDLGKGYYRIKGRNLVDKEEREALADISCSELGVPFDIVTNFRNVVQMKLPNIHSIVSYDGVDYLIGSNGNKEYFLKVLSNVGKINGVCGDNIVRKAKEIDYINNGLFKVVENESSVTRVYDVKAEKYIKFPDGMSLNHYYEKEGLLVLSKADDESNLTPIVIDRNGKIIYKSKPGAYDISVVGPLQFLTQEKQGETCTESYIDLERSICIDGYERLVVLKDSGFAVIKEGKLFILDKDRSIKQEYSLGDNRSFICCVDCSNENEYRISYANNVTVIINTKENTVKTLNYIEPLDRTKVVVFRNEDGKEGLRTGGGNVILNCEYDEIIGLYDNIINDTRYYLLKQSGVRFILDLESRALLNVKWSYIDDHFDGGFLRCWNRGKNGKIILLDENLNVAFELERRGKNFHYGYGVLCYNVGGDDKKYTIITQDSATKEITTLMEPTYCSVRMIGDRFLEIRMSEYSDKREIFDLKERKFIKLDFQISVENGRVALVGFGDSSNIQIGMESSQEKCDGGPLLEKRLPLPGEQGGI